MTPTRYRECLAAVGQSQRGLAAQLGVSDRLTRAWASGRSRISDDIAAWLEEWAAIRLAHPDPPPPQAWRQRRCTLEGL
jgi:hypothetical protein